MVHFCVHSSINFERSPTHLTKMQPETMTEPPLCYSNGCRHSLLSLLTSYEHTDQDSSVYMSHWYWFWVQFLCTLAYLSLFLQCCPFLLIAQPLFHCYLFDEPSVNNRWINWINLSVLCRDFFLPLLLFSTCLVSLNCLRTYRTPRFQLIAL